MTISPDPLRAAHLDAVLAEYCSQSSPTENLIDLLADAMHWCLLNGERFAALLATAQMHVEIDAGVYSGKPPPPPINGSDPDVRFPMGLRPTGKRLLALSDQTARFARTHNVWLSFEDYVHLTEQQAALKAIAQLLGAFNADTHLAEKIRQAEECLAWMQARAELQTS